MNELSSGIAGLLAGFVMGAIAVIAIHFYHPFWLSKLFVALGLIHGTAC
jgi:hypothetical protein